jgi:hypothetical protein
MNRGPERGLQLGERDSNPSLQVSETWVLPLYDPPAFAGLKTGHSFQESVGLEGIEPSSHRLRAECVSRCHHRPIRSFLIEWDARESNSYLRV